MGFEQFSFARSNPAREISLAAKSTFATTVLQTERPQATFVCNLFALHLQQISTFRLPLIHRSNKIIYNQSSSTNIFLFELTHQKNKCDKPEVLSHLFGAEGGIRTHVRVAPQTDFESAPL